MKTSRELEVQKLVTDKLISHELFPFSVIFSYLGGSSSGLLSITMFLPQQLDKVLDLLDYKYECDKSNYIILRETNTLCYQEQHY